MAETPQVVEAAAPGLECPECGATIEPKGKQSPAMALGLHRKNAHGVAGKYAERRGPKKPPQEREAPTPLAVVHDMAASASKGKGAPSPAQLTSAFGKGFGYVAMFSASRLVESDPRLTTDAQRVNAIEALAPTQHEAEAVVSPLARVLAKTRLNQTAGRAIVDNIDIADSVFAALEIARRFSEYRREIRAHEAALANGAVTPLVSVPTGAPAPGATAGVPLGADVDPDYARQAEQLGYLPAGAPHTPPPADGVVVSAADIARSLGNEILLPPDVNTGLAGTT